MTTQRVAPSRLPRGPHGLSADEVQASQRQRILDAAMDVVGERGYPAATVADITTAAGVSRTTFYALFSNKLEAFLAAYDQFGESFLADMEHTPTATPVDTLAAAGERLVEWGRKRPLACRAFLLEIYAVGEVGLQRRERMMDLAVELFERVAAWVRTVDPSVPEPPRLVGRAMAAASWELTSQAVRQPGDTTADSREALTYLWLFGLTGRPGS
ncbi:MAG: TetR/AcrR family transcriptional regulator [Marmoricola sp.]